MRLRLTWIAVPVAAASFCSAASSTTVRGSPTPWQKLATGYIVGNGWFPQTATPQNGQLVWPVYHLVGSRVGAAVFNDGR